MRTQQQHLSVVSTRVISWSIYVIAITGLGTPPYMAPEVFIAYLRHCSGQAIEG